MDRLKVKTWPSIDHHPILGVTVNSKVIFFDLFKDLVIFSSPGRKGQVSFSHHFASVVRRSRRRRRPVSSVNFYKNLLL